MKITYSATIPETIQGVIEQRVSRVKHLFPLWVNHLTIRYDGANIEDIATALPQYEYRAMTVVLHPQFLDDDDWEDSLIHEIWHGIFKPYVQAVDRIVEKFVPEDSRQYVLDMLTDKEEEVAEDSAIFSKKLRGRG